LLKIPHAFQQLLSGEKRPTLCGAIPAFERMINKWNELKVYQPQTAPFINEGVDKLNCYSNRISSVPAYVLAMGMLITAFNCQLKLTVRLLKAMNPAMKLNHFHNYPTEKEAARQLFLREVSSFKFDPQTSLIDSFNSFAHIIIILWCPKHQK